MTGPVRLPDDDSAASVARRIVRETLRDTSPEDEHFVDVAVQVVSELASNAVSHGDPPYGLDVVAVDQGLRLTVTNHGAQGEPQVKSAPTDAGRGRGLAMVEELADDWGWDRDGDLLAVWATVSRG